MPGVGEGTEHTVHALNRYDDFPFHQNPTPLDLPATSDSHFNDGYWWSWYCPDAYFFCGLRLHPNTNTMDGYAGVVHDGRQRNLRVSRALRPDFDNLAVGPLDVEITEPLQTQRLRLSDNETGVAFDVEATRSAPLFVEAPHVHYRFGRLFNQIIRYSGCTRVNGTAWIEGTQVPVDSWYGARDHSWGIRSSMGPHVPIGGVQGAADRDPRAIRLWIPFELDDQSGFFHLHEDADGNVLDFEGRLYAGNDTVVLASARHQLRYEPGTRRLAGGGFTLVDHDGTAHEYEFTVVGYPAHPQGFGYARGWCDGGNPGVYRGVTYHESDTFDVTDATRVAGPEHALERRRLGGTEYAATLRGPHGTRGMAHVEHMVYGTYHPYGFSSEPG